MTNITPSGSDDTKRIQDALVPGATLDFSPGTYKVGSVTLVSDITWNAIGSTFQNISLTGTIDKVNMNGGTYAGNASRIIEVVATNSNFSSMTISAPSGSSSQHGFGLQTGSYGNKCNKIVSNHAALADKCQDPNKGNEWTDCVYNGDSGTIDGFIIKCKNSTFTRCIVNSSKVAGWGFYAKLDTAATGIEISNNKFIDCEAHNNGHAGFSLNCPSNGPKSNIHDNFVQGVSTGNSQGGISFSNTANGGINEKNTFDIIVHDNPGGGIVIHSGSNSNSGNVVAYSNSGDIQIDSSTSGNSVIAYHPTDKPAPTISGQNVTIKDFSCTNLPVTPSYCAIKYCGGVIPQNIQASLQIAPNSIGVGQSTTITATVTGGNPPYSYNWTKLPTGCTGTNTNIITCNPTAKGTFNISVDITDSSSPKNKATSTGTLTVDSTPSNLKVQLETSSKTVKVKHKVTIKTKVSGGTKPYSYAYSGLPHPCKSANKDNIDCSPDQKGMYTITVNVTDSKGNTGTDSHSLEVK